MMQLAKKKDKKDKRKTFKDRDGNILKSKKNKLRLLVSMLLRPY